jgi:hypothetical protein
MELNSDDTLPETLELMAFGVDSADGALLLDAFLVEAQSALGPRGWPVTLRLRRSGTASLDAWTQGILAQWAEDDLVIELRFRGEGRSRRVSITDGSSTLHFGTDSSEQSAR